MWGRICRRLCLCRCRFYLCRRPKTRSPARPVVDRPFLETRQHSRPWLGAPHEDDDQHFASHLSPAADGPQPRLAMGDDYRCHVDDGMVLALVRNARADATDTAARYTVTRTWAHAGDAQTSGRYATATQ